MLHRVLIGTRTAVTCCSPPRSLATPPTIVASPTTRRCMEHRRLRGRKRPSLATFAVHLGGQDRPVVASDSPLHVIVVDPTAGLFIFVQALLASDTSVLAAICTDSPDGLCSLPPEDHRIVRFAATGYPVATTINQAADPFPGVRILVFVRAPTTFAL